MIGVDLSRKVIPDDHLNLETCEFKRYEYYIYTPLTKKGKLQRVLFMKNLSLFLVASNFFIQY